MAIDFGRIVQRLTGRNSNRSGTYRTNEEILYALDSIREDCDAVIFRTQHVVREDFLEDEDTVKAGAMDFINIGNSALKLPDSILGQDRSLADAYGFRCRIAHGHKSERFDPRYLWSAVHEDVCSIKSTCARIAAEIGSGKSYRRLRTQSSKSDESRISHCWLKSDEIVDALW